jgi:hypothetical protein
MLGSVKYRKRFDSELHNASDEHRRLNRNEWYDRLGHNNYSYSYSYNYNRYSKHTVADIGNNTSIRNDNHNHHHGGYNKFDRHLLE